MKLITFTGSGAVGWGIAERAHRKRVKLELGNATPAIVCCRRAARHAPPSSPRTRSPSPARAASPCSGSSCCGTPGTTSSPSSCRRSKRSQVGDPADEDTDVGPVIDEGERDRILEWIARVAAGEVLTGGDATADGLIRPTVIATPRADRPGVSATRSSGRS